MKVCLYLEFYHFLGGIFYKNIGTGLLSSYLNQKKTLAALGIEVSEKWDNSCNILQINTPWLKSLWLIKKARQRKIRIIIWSHVTVEDFKQVFRFNKFIAPLMKKYLTYTYGLADLVFCPSQYTKSLLLAYGLPEQKLIVQSNGVDRSLFYHDDKKREIAREQYNCKKLVVGTVGLVIPRKGVIDFIELAKNNPKQQFVWFGKIYNKLMAQSLPKTLPTNVQFTGYVDDICAAFNAIDIFIFLSSEENQGMVLLEAASVGLPILVLGLPAYKGWLRHRENCLIANNYEEVEKYLDLLITDDNLRKHLIQGAQNLAENEDINSLNKKLIVIYQKLLDEYDYKG